MIPFILVPLLVLDQLTKYATRQLLVVNESIVVVKGFFHITLVYNRGAAFGILKNQLVLFIVTSVFAIGLIWTNLKKDRTPHKITLEKIALNAILAGAVGNLIDRLLYGYVVDFLDFRIWPVFNIADSAITVGAILLVYSILFPKQRHSHPASPH